MENSYEERNEEKKISWFKRENRKFRQQQLDAWQPILTPTWVIATFLFVVIFFIPIGTYIWVVDDSLFEAKIIYDSNQPSKISTTVSPLCSIDTINEGYIGLDGGTREFNDCTLTFEFTQDIDESDPVYLYYQLENFYQNHRRYVKSVSDDQLTDSVIINPANTQSTGSLETVCSPDTSLKTKSNRVLFPCGLIANSFFNDGIDLYTFSRQGLPVQEYAAGVLNKSVTGLEDISIDTQNIAWPSDLDGTFRNPTATDCKLDVNNPGGNLCPLRYYQYQYSWQTYNEFLCYDPVSPGSNVPDLSKPAECKTFDEFVRDIALQNYSLSQNEWDTFLNSKFSNSDPLKGKCASCKIDTSIFVSAGGIQLPADLTSDLSDEGIRTEAFVVWMRTAGLPVFRKTLGVITPPKGGFKKTDQISFSVVPNFEVKSIIASKGLVIGTESQLGGKNNTLGIAYVAVGCICFVFVILLLIKMKLCPRRLGDPAHLNWRKNE